MTRSRTLTGVAGVAPGQAQRRARPRRRRDRDVLLALVGRRRRPRRELRPRHHRSASASTTTRCARATRASCYCSITGYGRDTRHADRPGYDALVAARTGMQWEQRGRPGGTIGGCAGGAPNLPELDAPGRLLGRRRARRARCSRAPRGRASPPRSSPPPGSAPRCAPARSPGAGSGSRRRCSRACWSPPRARWQRAEHPDAPRLPDTWIIDPRAHKGLFECADGRWVHHWVPNPAFVLGVVRGRRARRAPTATHGTARRSRLASAPSREEIVVLHHYHPMHGRRRIGKFPADEWVRVGGAGRHRHAAGALARGGARRPGAARRRLRRRASTIPSSARSARSGSRTGMSAAPAERPRARARASASTPTRCAPKPAALAPSRDRRRRPPTARSPAPLDGIRVLDLGLAVAGPLGTQLLADLGADVIKINTLHDGYWHAQPHRDGAATAASAASRLDLKDPRGHGGAAPRWSPGRRRAAQHALRGGRRGSASTTSRCARSTRPRSTATPAASSAVPRSTCPATTRPAPRSRGIEWEDGGVRRRRPADLEPHVARRHRQRLPVGDRDHPGALCTATAPARASSSTRRSSTPACSTRRTRGSPPTATPPSARTSTREQLGFTALYRLYETRTAGSASPCSTDEHWEALRKALGATDLAADARFADRAGPRAPTTPRSGRRSTASSRRAPRPSGSRGSTPPACRSRSSDDDVRRSAVFDDPELIGAAGSRGTSRGSWDGGSGWPAVRLLGDAGPHRGAAARRRRLHPEILRETGYDDPRIDALAADGVVLEAPA